MAVGIARSRLIDSHLAEDAAQEAFATACRMLPTLASSERFPQWLGTICRRIATQMAVRRSKQAEVLSTQFPSHSPDADSLKESLREALSLLDLTSREIVMLHYYSGLTYVEIADFIDLTPGAVHGRLQRARAKLAELLTQGEQKSGVKEDYQPRETSHE